jgi:hypothetical protein
MASVAAPRRMASSKSSHLPHRLQSMAPILAETTIITINPLTIPV